MKEVETKRDRCLLIAALCRCRASLEMRSTAALVREQEALFNLVEAVAAEELTGTTPVVAIDRMSRLAEVLKLNFPQDHAVWGYVRWKWSGAA